MYIYPVNDFLYHQLRYFFVLTLSRRRALLYRNQSIDLQNKSIDWFLYDIGLRRERVKCKKTLIETSTHRFRKERHYSEKFLRKRFSELSFKLIYQIMVNL